MIPINRIKRSDGSHLDIVKLHSSSLHKIGGRRSWVIIWNRSGPGKGRKVVRRALGMPPEKGFDGKTIELDYDSMIDLNFGRGGTYDNGFIECDLGMTKADFIDQAMHHINSPDYDHRFAVRLALLSLAVSIIGFIT